MIEEGRGDGKQAENTQDPNLPGDLKRKCLPQEVSGPLPPSRFWLHQDCSPPSERSLRNGKLALEPRCLDVNLSSTGHLTSGKALNLSRPRLLFL